MHRVVASLIGLVIFVSAPMVAEAQPWAGIMSPPRAMDWSKAGVEGGIPTNRTQCGPTINAYSGTAATITNALAACGSGHYVLLGPGTFTLSTGILFDDDNVTLRGSGADATKIVFTGTVGGCHIGDDAGIKICENASNIGVDNSYDYSASWTAGHAQGTSVVTLSSTTGLAVGSTLYLDQADDTTDGYPGGGDLFICANTASGCSSQGGGGQLARPGRAQVTLHKVTAVSGTSVTIDPPVYLPNFRSAKSPGAWWGAASSVLQGGGVENVTIDMSAISNGIEMVNCTGCWVKGVRFVYKNSPSGSTYPLKIINGFRVTVQSNYFWGPEAPPANENYTINMMVAGSLLVQNNIFHHVIAGMVPNAPVTGSVFAYNFVTDSFYVGPGYVSHGLTLKNLIEGNNMSAGREDIIHAPHYFQTYFRNHMDGHQNNPPANRNSMFQFESKSRFMNVIGNVLGDTSYINNYQTNQASGETSIFELGWRGDNSGADPGNDSNVLRTLFRWGNWDTKTNATRWCSDATAPCTGSEVPSGIANYANVVPGSHTLPNSFYLASKPAWFGSIAWPPIGPDVTGGSVPGYGGHANKIPARVCFESLRTDSAYGTKNIRSFNADACYGTGGATIPAPTAPTGVVIK